jgi:hypothetical protein
MKKTLASLLLICFVALFAPACDTQKPAEEVESAGDRVEKKIKDARAEQEAENPEKQEESDQEGQQ